MTGGGKKKKKLGVRFRNVAVTRLSGQKWIDNHCMRVAVAVCVCVCHGVCVCVCVFLCTCLHLRT